MKSLHNVSDLMVAIESKYYSINNNDNLYIILIGGCSRSGKSYISNYIEYKLNQCEIKTQVICLDSWLLSINQRKLDSTVMGRYDVENIKFSIGELLKGKTIFPPIYEPLSRLRICDGHNNPLQINDELIIIEGVIALAIPELLELSSFNIFINIPDNVRIKRLSKFYLEEKKISDQEFKMIMELRELEETPFIKSTKINAEIIYNNTNLKNNYVYEVF